jgi:hypothetical protein
MTKASDERFQRFAEMVSAKAMEAHAKRLAQLRAEIEGVIGRLTDLQRPFQASISTLQRIEKMALPDAILTEGIAECRRIGSELRRYIREEPAAEMGKRLLELERKLVKFMERTK